jgi:hypothetical protein
MKHHVENQDSHDVGCDEDEQLDLQGVAHDPGEEERDG